MKVYRMVSVKFDTDHIEVGDKFKTEIVLPTGNMEIHTATVIQKRAEYDLCLFDECLGVSRPIHHKIDTGGILWETCDLRFFLKKIKIKISGAFVVPDELGDDVSILSTREMFGVDGHLIRTEEQAEWLKNRNNRVAGGGVYDRYWLKTPTFSDRFAIVNYDELDDLPVNIFAGIRLCFRIAVPKSDDDAHWIDNADSYLCPCCRFETHNPNKYGRKCPRCGFREREK